MHRIGIIGLGIMGQRMMSAMNAHPEFEIAQIWDLNSELLSEISTRYPDAIPAADATSLSSAKNLDLVYIATPPATHIEYARLAMNGGKAILCEKPLAVDLEETRSLVEEVKQSGIPNAVQFPFASDLNITTLEEDLQNKLHGEIERVEIRFHFNNWPRIWQSDAASWLSGREQGGYLREVFSHFVYLTHRLVGEMNINLADVRFPKDPAQSEHFAAADFTANGTQVILQGGVGGAAPDFNEWTLFGTERSYRIQDWGQLKVANTNRWYDMMPRGESKPPLFHQLDNISNMLHGRPHPLPSFADGLKVQQVVEGLFEYAH